MSRCTDEADDAARAQRIADFARPCADYWRQKCIERGMGDFIDRLDALFARHLAEWKRAHP